MRLSTAIPGATKRNAQVILRAVAIRGELRVPVTVHSGFSRRTDGSVRAGTSVYFDDANHNEQHPDGWALTEFYPVLGTGMGRDLYDYIVEGARFETLDGCPLLDDTTTAVEIALEERDAKVT